MARMKNRHLGLLLAAAAFALVVLLPIGVLILVVLAVRNGASVDVADARPQPQQVAAHLQGGPLVEGPGERGRSPGHCGQFAGSRRQVKGKGGKRICPTQV